MSSALRHRLALLCAVPFLLTSFCATSIAGEYLRIEPGSRKISDEERALAPDPNEPGQSAVILLYREDRDESDIHFPKTTVHLRAKIFSGNGGDLANVDVPETGVQGNLIRWWARTLLPDGKVIELTDRDLLPQTIVKTGGFKAVVRRAAMKGVEPGCVIDYGYSVRVADVWFIADAPLQLPWAVRRLQFRWLPSNPTKWSYEVENPANLDLKATRDVGLLTIAGSSLPPLSADSDPSSAAHVMVSHGLISEARQTVDETTLRRREMAARAFSEGRPAQRAVEVAVAAIPFPPEASLRRKIVAAYDWILKNIASIGEESLEEMEARPVSAETDKKAVLILSGKADTILAEKRAFKSQLDFLFLAFARALGAEAYPVAATNRAPATGPSPGKVSLYTETLTAVREPGDPLDKLTFVDAGSGLPYGEVPWWVTSAKAVVFTREGRKEAQIPASDPKRNLTETRVTMTIPEAGEPEILWSRISRGQQGLVERRSLRKRTPEERKSRFDTLCGGGSVFEVTRAEGSDVQEAGGDFRLVCEGRALRSPSVPYDRLIVGFMGAWIPPGPEFDPAAKAQPILFPFPRVDVTIIDLVAPPGFAPSEAPPEVKLETAFGRYLLSVRVTENGFRVWRDHALVSPVVTEAQNGDLRSFLAAVRSADLTRLEFVRSRPAP